MADALTNLYDLIYKAVLEYPGMEEYVQPQRFLTWEARPNKSDADPRDIAASSLLPRLALYPTTDELTPLTNASDFTLMVGHELVLHVTSVCIDIELNPIKVLIYRALAKLRTDIIASDLGDSLFRVDEFTFGGVTSRISVRPSDDDSDDFTENKGWMLAVPIYTHIVIG